MVNSSEDLFRTLHSFRAGSSNGDSPQKLLLDYCTQVLGSIENIHVDFKEKRDRRDAVLADDDMKNLAKAVSGFANSSGGVLIWGIDDKNHEPKPIKEVQKFVSNLLQLASQTTDPNVLGIEGDWIPADGDPDEGFSLLFIPESMLPPHRIILNGNLKNHYYVRSGNSFSVATHTQLEDMFGRRPSPKLSLSTHFEVASSSHPEVHIRIIVGITNSGRGSARSPYLSVLVHPPYQIDEYGIDGNKRFGLRQLIMSGGSHEIGYGANSEAVIHPGMTYDITAVKLNVNVRMSPANIRDLVIEYKIAAEGINMIIGSITISRSDIWDFINSQP